MKLFSTLLVVVFWTAQIAAQNILIADNTRVSEVQPPVYKDLQAAIDAAQAGDVIHVMPSGKSYGNISIKKSVSLFGPGFNPNKEDEGTESSVVGNISFSNPVIGVRLSGLNTNSISLGKDIENLIVDKCLVRGSVSAQVQGAEFHSLKNLVFRHNIIKGQFWPSISTITQFNASGVTITHNVFSISGNSSPHLFNNSLVSNNLFIGRTFFESCNVIDNIFMGQLGARESQVINNLIANSISVNDKSTSLWSNNMEGQVAIFENYDTNSSGYNFATDFRLKSDSPGKNAGSDGKDVGVYGGATPFEPTGGALPSITAFKAPVMVPAGEDLEVEIKVRAY